MSGSFFRTTVRNILRQKGFSVINIAGLATGIAASLLIYLWIQDEFSYDRFNRNARYIYRVEEDQHYSGEIFHVTVTPQPSGPVWRERIPEIADQTRVNRLRQLLFRKDETVFFEQSVVAADSGLFSIFTFPFIKGEASSALRNPNSIVLTEEMASKYFGDDDPLGQTLVLENRYTFTVTGVLKKIPENSSLNFSAVVPYSFLREINAYSDRWGNNSILTFMLLAKGADIKEVNSKLTSVVREYLPEGTTDYMLFPLLDIHLHSQFGFTRTNGPMTVIYIFSAIALFIILIASINFINLSTAKAVTRSREIGIKKVSGADRKSLVWQFMMESFMLVSVALIIALLLIVLLLGLFNDISGKQFVTGDLLRGEFIAGVIVTGFLTAVLSGVYPAFYLASFRPTAVLKGEPAGPGGGSRLRRGLVVMQFTLSILIAISATFMYLQLDFMQNKDLGFDKDNLIALNMSQYTRGRYYSLKNELTASPLITGVTASWHNPVMMGSNSGGARWDGKDPDKEVLIGVNAVDYDYLSTMKMKLASGRDFSREFPGDLAIDTTGNFLVNEEVVKVMNIGDPVGKHFNFMGIDGTIIGVLKNFHFKGADQPIEPMAFALADTSYVRVALIRLAEGRTAEALKLVESEWSRIIPEFPFRYTFIEQDYNDLFRSEMRLTSLLKYFTILALIIASLGLYGLSSYSAERRRGEVGIRKVMGATSGQVIGTMLSEYIGLILISLLIAIPSGWYIVYRLLQQFPYRITTSGYLFAAIAAGAVMIALVTVSFQAFRASRINPATALKRE